MQDSSPNRFKFCLFLEPTRAQLLRGLVFQVRLAELPRLRRRPHVLHQEPRGARGQQGVPPVRRL